MGAAPTSVILFTHEWSLCCVFIFDFYFLLFLFKRTLYSPSQSYNSQSLKEATDPRIFSRELIGFECALHSIKRSYDWTDGF